jgi:hypothetical protein
MEEFVPRIDDQNTTGQILKLSFFREGVQLPGRVGVGRSEPLRPNDAHRLTSTFESAFLLANADDGLISDGIFHGCDPF